MNERLNDSRVQMLLETVPVGATRHQIRSNASPGGTPRVSGAFDTPMATDTSSME